VLLQARYCQQDPRCHPTPLPRLPGIPKDIRYWNEPMLMLTLSQFPHQPPPPNSTKFEHLRIYQKIAPNAHKATGVAFLNLPPIFNALGASRCTYFATFNIPVSLFMLNLIILSIQLLQ
jgi:hypothetical protein